MTPEEFVAKNINRPVTIGAVKSALSDLYYRGSCPLTPPIMGALVDLGALETKDYMGIKEAIEAAEEKAREAAK